MDDEDGCWQEPYSTLLAFRPHRWRKYAGMLQCEYCRTTVSIAETNKRWQLARLDLFRFLTRNSSGNLAE